MDGLRVVDAEASGVFVHPIAHDLTFTVREELEPLRVSNILRWIACAPTEPLLLQELPMLPRPSLVRLVPAARVLASAELSHNTGMMGRQHEVLVVVHEVSDQRVHEVTHCLQHVLNRLALWELDEVDIQADEICSDAVLRQVIVGALELERNRCIPNIRQVLLEDFELVVRLV